MRKILSRLLTIVAAMVLVICCGVFERPHLLASSDDPAVSRVDRTVVSGFIEALGPGFVVVAGGRLDMSPDVNVVDKAGKEVPGGIKSLKYPVDADLILENDMVVQIQLVVRPR